MKHFYLLSHLLHHYVRSAFCVNTNKSSAFTTADIKTEIEGIYVLCGSTKQSLSEQCHCASAGDENTWKCSGSH